MLNAILHPRILRAFLRMYVEVGACVWAFAALDQPALKATAILAAYHLGALLRTRAEQRYRGRFDAARFLPAGLALTAIGYATVSELVAGAGLLMTGFLISASPFAAAAPGGSPARTTKIMAKLLGMTAPAVLPLSLFAYCLAGLLISLLVMWRTPSGLPSLPDASPSSGNPIDLTNVFHQAGYFAFCFSFWSMIPAVEPFLIALLFPLGWVAYWILELHLTGAPRFRQPLLSAGHLGFAATLLVMAGVSGNGVLVLIAWALTGLFGGTCYTMDHAPGGRPTSLSDDVGALLGSLTGALAIAVTDQPASAAILGAGFACATALAAFHLVHTSPQRG